MVTRTMTPRKFVACLKSLEAANAANRARFSFGDWVCQQCGKTEAATAHQRRKKYCSRPCAALAFKVRSVGANNPNFKDAGKKVCEFCKKQFKKYSPGRFCSKACAGAGLLVRGRAKKDANHGDVVAALEAGGAVVHDCSTLSAGFPDLLVWHRNQWQLVEIKNPATYYGRKGLTAAQTAFAMDWKGSPVLIVRTPADCDAFISGDYTVLESVGDVRDFHEQVCFDLWEAK